MTAFLDLPSVTISMRERSKVTFAVTNADQGGCSRHCAPGRARERPRRRAYTASFDLLGDGPAAQVAALGLRHELRSRAEGPAFASVVAERGVQ